MYKATAAEVSKLRNATGAGMMDSKKALEEAAGDFDKAIEILRKQGQQVAAKGVDRDRIEGALIAVVEDDMIQGGICSLSCDTELAATSYDFVALARELGDIALNRKCQEGLTNASIGGITVSEKLIQQTGVIGE